MNLKKYQDIKQYGKNKIGEYRFLLKPTLILSTIYLLAMSAILRANVFYVDDMARARMGYAGWEPYSRYLSNFLSQYLHADKYLTDISPLTQIIAAVAIAFAAVIAIYMITGKRQISCWHLIAAIPVGLSPYFLECLTYKYDSPYMALSVLFSVLPLLFSNGNQIVYVLITAVSMICMCTTYQASSGIFPMLVVITGLYRWLHGEKAKVVVKFYVISALAYVLGLLYFRKFIMTEYVDYAATTVASMENLYKTADFNYKRYIVYFLQDYKPEWLAAAFVICLCFVWRAVTQSRQNKLLTLILVPIAMGIMFLLSFGVFPFLESPLWVPRAMYGVGCFMGFVGIFAVSEVPHGYLSKLACFVLGWYFFVFSFTYGNALNVQQEYTEFRIEEAIDDLLCAKNLNPMMT